MGDNSRRSYTNLRSSRGTFTGRLPPNEEDQEERGTILFNATNEFKNGKGIIEESHEDSKSSQGEDMAEN